MIKNEFILSGMYNRGRAAKICLLAGTWFRTGNNGHIIFIEDGEQFHIASSFISYTIDEMADIRGITAEDIFNNALIKYNADNKTPA